jgi:hypothetical protein
VVIFSVLENEVNKFGVPEEGSKEHEAPAGSPAVQAKETVWGAPLSKVAVTVAEPELPWRVVIPPGLVREKPKDRGEVVMLVTDVHQERKTKAFEYPKYSPAVQITVGLDGSTAEPK